jgi:hypothetical protein
MTRHAGAARAALLALSLTLLPALLAAQGRAPAAAPATGAWTRVPALPAGCYSGADDFGARLASAIEATKADRESHDERKEVLRAKLAAVPPMEVAQRMQAYMMKHPEEALAASEASHATSTAASAARMQDGGDYYKAQEFRQFAPNFREALAAAIAPSEAAIAAHIDAKATWDAHHFFFEFKAPADEARLLELVAQQSAAYERLCGAWLVGNGTIPAWMRTYRSYLTDELVPTLEASDRAAMAQMRMILGDEMSEYSSREALDAVLDYLEKASAMNDLRLAAKYGPPKEFKKKS